MDVMPEMLGINHQSPLIHFVGKDVPFTFAGNQSPIPFDTLNFADQFTANSWESITNPL